MNTSRSRESTGLVDFIVVGAGPVGLATAILLGREGWRVTIDHEALRILQGIGVMREHAAAGLHMPLQDKRSALTWLWAKLGAHMLHVDVATVPLEELPTAWARAGNVAAREVRGAALAAQRK